jgi:hypothetical protein
MSETPSQPPEARSRTHGEFEDPHYHDEDLDVQSDEPPRPGKALVKKKPRKLAFPRRHFPDD